MSSALVWASSDRDVRSSRVPVFGGQTEEPAAAARGFLGVFGDLGAEFWLNTQLRSISVYSDCIWFCGVWQVWFGISYSEVYVWFRTGLRLAWGLFRIDPGLVWGWFTLFGVCRRVPAASGGNADHISQDEIQHWIA